MGHGASCLNCPLPVMVQLQAQARAFLPCCPPKEPGLGTKSRHQEMCLPEASGLMVSHVGSTEQRGMLANPRVVEAGRTLTVHLQRWQSGLGSGSPFPHSNSSCSLTC